MHPSLIRLIPLSFWVFLTLSISSIHRPALHGAETLPDHDDPDNERRSFQLLDGFRANLFASEQDGVINPIQIRWDARGRLWVITSTVYPQLKPGQKPNDKVLVLEDLDRDGRSDRTTVFADGLLIPTGIELGDGGAYVGHGTELLHLKDTDGDLKADERRVVLRGFGTGDAHQNINSFIWGPSGELLMSQGLHAFSTVETPWGREVLHEAGFWRWWPKRMRLDPFFGNGMAPHNPWGFVFDEWGQLIVVAGNGHGIYDPLPAMVRYTEPLPLDQIWDDRKKLCGVDRVVTRHFPDSMQRELMAGGFMNNAVYRLKLEDNGSAHRIRSLEPLMVSSHVSFRPVDVRFGPDGAVYLADWYNPIIGHYQASFRHPDRDKAHGRIWRIAHEDRPLVDWKPLAGTGASGVRELLKQLDSEEHWARYQARRLLRELPAAEVVPAIKNYLSESPSLDLQLKVRLLGLLQAHESVHEPLLRELLKAGKPEARAFAAGMIGHWHDRLNQPLQLLEYAVQDPDLRTRLEAVIAASYVRTPRTVALALKVLDRKTDPFLEYGLKQTVLSLKPIWLDSFKNGELEFANTEHLEFLLGTDRSRDTLDALIKLLQEGDLTPTTREDFLKILVHQAPAEFVGVVLDKDWVRGSRSYDPQLQGRVLMELATAVEIRGLKADPKWSGELKNLLDVGNETLSIGVLQLANALALEGFLDETLALAGNGKVSLAVRQAALRNLGRIGAPDQVLPLLKKQLTERAPEELRHAAMQAIAQRNLALAAQHAAELLSTAGPSSEKEVKRLIGLFLERQEGAETLAAALQSISLSPKAAQAGLSLLAASGRESSILQDTLKSKLALQTTAWNLSEQEMGQWAREIRAKGNPDRGKEIFQEPTLGCASCHAIEGAGGVIGPDLGDIGTGQPLDFILGAILYPQREVKEGFQSVEIITKDGQVYQGYLVKEDENQIQLKDILRDEVTPLPKSNVKHRKLHGSLMPEGLVDHLSRDQLRDLVAYLGSLGR